MRSNDGTRIPGWESGADKEGELTRSGVMGQPADRHVKIGAIIGMPKRPLRENLDDPGFQTEGYIFKHGTPYGETARFNVMPPGQDISNQPMLIVNQMPLKKVTAMSYPGDGAFEVRDLPE